MDDGFVSDAEVVTHGWGEIDAGVLVFGVFGAFVAEDVFVVIGEEGSAVFPLGVADLLGGGAVNLNPTSLANGFTGIGIDSTPPRDDARGFWFMRAMIEAIVVGEGDVEGVESRDKGFGAIAEALRRVGVIVTAEILGPFGVPR